MGAILMTSTNSLEPQCYDCSRQEALFKSAHSNLCNHIMANWTLKDLCLLLNVRFLQGKAGNQTGCSKQVTSRRMLNLILTAAHLPISRCRSWSCQSLRRRCRRSNLLQPSSHLPSSLLGDQQSKITWGKEFTFLCLLPLTEGSYLSETHLHHHKPTVSSLHCIAARHFVFLFCGASTMSQLMWVQDALFWQCDSFRCCPSQSASSSPRLTKKLR